MTLDGVGSLIELNVDAGPGGATDITVRYESAAAKSVAMYLIYPSYGELVSDIVFPESATYSPPFYSDTPRDFSNLTQNVILQPGQNTIRLVLGDSGTFKIDRIELSQMERVEGLAIGYESWAAGKGLTGGPQDDDDGNGVSNFKEYAFNGAPTPQITLLDDKVMITYFRRKDDLSLVYETQKSLDLNQWEFAGTLVDLVDDGDYEIVTEEFGVGTDPLFVRALVTQE
jgi:hypothetical protein